MKTSYIISLLSLGFTSTTLAAPIEAQVPETSWQWRSSGAFSNGFPPSGFAKTAIKIKEKRDPFFGLVGTISPANAADDSWTGGRQEEKRSEAEAEVFDIDIEKREPVNLKLIKAAAPSQIPSFGKFLWSKITGKPLTKREAEPVNLKLIKAAAPSQIPSFGKFLWSKITGKKLD